METELQKELTQIIPISDISDTHRRIFAEMLKKQGKVRGPFIEMADRCHLIAITTIDNQPVSIGAIKKKTGSDFYPNKAGDPKNISSQFDWELGYFYTVPKLEGHGFGKHIASSLLKEYGDRNLMASTELTQNPAMVSILNKNGFIRYGQSWQSGMPHGNELGLFLKCNK